MKQILIVILLAITTPLIVNSQSLLSNPSELSGTMSSENFTITYGEQEVGTVVNSENYTLIVGFLGAALPRLNTSVKFQGPALDIISVFPNPFQSTINLKIKSTTIKDMKINLVTPQGKFIHKWTIEQQLNNVDKILSLQHIPAGNYFLQITEASKIVGLIQIVKE